MSSKAKGHFESDTTQFLRELETKTGNNESPARSAEQVKYARINTLRDEVQTNTASAPIWKGF